MVTRRSLVVALAGTVCGTGCAGAQCQPQILEFMPVAGSKPAHATISWDLDGPGPLPLRSIIGGTLDNINGQAIPQLAAWDGATWEPIGTGFEASPGTSPAVRALAVFDGLLVVAGQFVAASGVETHNIIGFDGQRWRTLGNGLHGGQGFDSVVHCLHTDDADLYAGGHFIAADGVLAHNIARWDGERWHALGGGVSEVRPGIAGPPLVRSIATHHGEIYIGGTFWRAGPGITANIARWDGSEWHSVGAGLTMISGDVEFVDALASHGGVLVASGMFLRSGSTGLGHSGAWDGSAWTNIAGLKGAGVFSTELAAHQGHLYIVHASSPTLPGFYKRNGAQWTAVPEALSIGGYSLTTFGKDLVAVGFGWTRWGCACQADCDASGGLNIDDFICFQTLFALGDPAADCDASGALNIDDFVCFQTFFALGC